MIGKCKLCGQQKKLCLSHIIPEFFYNNIYDLRPRRFWFLKFDTKANQKKQEQKGLRERLLCKKCENEFSSYEKYAAEIIYAKNRKSPVKLINQSSNGKITVNEFTGFDYNKFKFFLESILWRISVSSEKFNVVNISDKHRNKLHKSLKDKTVLDENEYPCFIQVVTHDDGTYFRYSILGPYETEYSGHQVINLLADGFLFSFIMGRIVLSPEIQNTMLNRKGKMSILTKKVQTDSNLKEAARLFKEKYPDYIRNKWGRLGLISRVTKHIQMPGIFTRIHQVGSKGVHKS